MTTAIYEWDNLSALEQYFLLVLREDERLGYRNIQETKPKLVMKKLKTAYSFRKVPLQSVEIPRSINDSNRFLYNYSSRILLDLYLEDWKDLLPSLNKENLPFNHIQIEHMQNLSNIWNNLINASLNQRLSIFENFVKFLVEALSWTYKRKIRVENMEYHFISIEDILFKLPYEIPVILTSLEKGQNKVNSAYDDIIFLQHKLLKDKVTKDRLIINVVTGKMPELSHYMNLFDKDRKVIVIDEKRLKIIFLSRKYSTPVNNIIRSCIGISSINPYRFEKPVSKSDMFFGRSIETDKVLDNPSTDYIIVGSRRIGKSSLCIFIKNRCEQLGDRIPFYIDCSAISSAEELIYKLTSKINPRRADKISLSTFDQMVNTNQTHKGKRYIFIFDEIDALLRISVKNADYRLFNVLRGLSQSQVAQSIFTGYRVLYEEWMKLDSPFFNYVSTIYLSTLDKTSAKSLITLPLQNVGVSFESKNLIDNILDQTGCHPCLIQFFCSSLVNLADKKDSTKTEINRNDFNSVLQSKNYREFVLKPFHHDMNLTSLEKVIILECARMFKHDFTAINLIRALSPYNMRTSAEKVIKALSGLEIAGLISRYIEENPLEPGNPDTKYKVLIPAFLYALKKEHPVERELNDLIKRLQ